MHARDQIRPIVDSLLEAAKRTPLSPHRDFPRSDFLRRSARS